MLPRKQFLALALTVCSCLSVLTAQVTDEQRARQAVDHYRVGQEYLHAEKFEKAVTEFSTAIELDPLLTLAHYGLGQSYMSLKSYPEAINAFSGCRDAYRKIAALAISNQVAADQRHDDEIRELKDSIRRIQQGQINASPLVVVRLESRIRDLERMRQSGLEGQDVPAEVLLALGSAFFRNGALDDAEREYLASIKVNSRLGEAHNNLAVVYMLTGRLTGAEDEVKLAEKAGYRVNPGLKEDLRKRRNEPHR